MYMYAHQFPVSLLGIPPFLLTLLHTYVTLHTFCFFDTYFSHVNINVRLAYCKSVSFHGTLLVTTDWTTFCDSSSVTRSPQSRSKSRSRSQSQSRSKSQSRSLSLSQSQSQSQSKSQSLCFYHGYVIIPQVQSTQFLSMCL